MERLNEFLVQRLTNATQTSDVEAALACLERLKDFAAELSEECGLKPEGSIANQIGRAIGLMRQLARVKPTRTRVSEVKMRTVGYGRTVNTGNYETLKYYLEAEVEPDDHWFNSLNNLVEQINRIEGNRKHILDFEREYEELERRKERIQAQVDRFQSRLKALLNRVDEVSNFLKQHGIDPLTMPAMFFLPQPQELVEPEPEPISRAKPEPVPDPDEDDDYFGISFEEDVDILGAGYTTTEPESQ